VDAFGVPLDVTDDASLAASAQLLTTHGGLDVLVNNAGITGGMPQNPTAISPAAVLRVVDTNVVGVLRVTNACLLLLRESAHPRVVVVSSSVGSLTLADHPRVVRRTGLRGLRAVQDVGSARRHAEPLGSQWDARVRCVRRNRPPLSSARLASSRRPTMATNTWGTPAVASS